MESEVLRQFYSDIQHAITDPIAVASLLHQEDVVGKVLLDEVSPSNKITYPEKTASIMRHVDAAIRVDPKSFWVFLSVLDQFTPCYKVAMRMKQAVDLHALAAEGKRSLPSSQNSKDDHDVTVSVVYKEDFDAIEKEFVLLHLRASHIILKKSSVTLKELKELLSFYPQLVMLIREAENVTEVMQVIQQHSSFINCSYLKHVAEYFNLPEVTKEIDNYNKLVDTFCNSKIIQHSYMKPFTTNPPQYTVSSQTIKIKIMLEWNPADKTLSDIRSLLRKVFKGLSSLIHVDVIGEGSVTVVCYAPHYLMGALLKMTKKNKSMLLENSVSYLSIGYAVVLDCTSQKEELEEEILVLKERKTSSLTSLQAIQSPAKNKSSQQTTYQYDSSICTTTSDGNQSKIKTDNKTAEAESVMEKTSAKHVYTEFYHQLVDAVSDPLTCQSLTAQLHSTTLISQEKMAQLSSGQHTGSSFLKVLGVEEDLQLLTAFIEKMANVEQLQMLWESMSTWLSTMKQDTGDEPVTTASDEQASGQLSTVDEEQQQLLQQYQRMTRARDVRISQLQNQNEFVQDKYDALKASYLQLQAASNKKQPMDTVDTGVQTDYLTVAPGNAEQAPPIIAVSSPQSGPTTPAVTTLTPGATSSAAHQQLTPISTTCSTTQQQPVVQSAVVFSLTKEDLSFSYPKPISLSFPFESIREYQKELAGPGLNGENYIVCAPTGSGKTLVAAMIISEHLKKGQEIGEERKVLFMVKTQQLAHQQKKRLETYVDGARIDKVIGEEEQLLIAQLLPKMDLIVCTAGKIRNELKNKKVAIGQFSLLVVDECHHTVGNDYYSEVLEFYLIEKLQGSRSSKVPQVVGFTASPGAGKGRSPSLFKAMNHQLELCARLDAFSGIKLVTENVDELLANTNKPDHILTELKTRSLSEPFTDILISAMKRLEEIIKGGPPFNRNSYQYKRWVEIEKEKAEIKESPDERDCISVLQYLGQYYQALTTYEDFSSEDAIEILKEIEHCPYEQATPTEQFLIDNHKEILLQLSKLPPICNPLLEGVEKILFDQFTNKPDSKAIFFVREICHTRYVQRWVENCPSLKPKIHVSSIMGYTRAGMTKEQQMEAIRGFRSEKYNLLVSTSVLEEGIDVAACNLVIRFQIVSNEIAEVQAQGRARPRESKMYTIMSSKSEKQYQQLVNEEKKLLALKAPSFVTEQCMTPTFIEKQKAILLEREARERANAMRKQLWKPEEVNVICKKCKIVACKGSDIKRLESHYVVPDIEFRQAKMIRRPHLKRSVHGSMHSPYKIYCRKCNQDWGVWSWWSNYCVEYPVLKCASFNFWHSKTEVHPGKQWSKVLFEIYPLSMDIGDDNDNED